MNCANDNQKNFFEELESQGVTISAEQREQINYRLQKILNYRPKIGVFGKTGVGKSSLCNALFGKDICPISDVEACTRATKEVLLEMGQGNEGVILVDVPGVGESRDRDKEYATLYAKLLPELDVVLWLIKADDRAMSSDETFYKEIVKPHVEKGKPFFFVLNQVDKIEPFREWDVDNHKPSAKQLQNIVGKIADVAKNFDIAESKIIDVSANEKYNLVKLVDEFVRALPAEKRITTVPDLDPDVVSDSLKRDVEKSWIDVVVDTVCTVVEVAKKILDILPIPKLPIPHWPHFPWFKF